MSDDPVSPNASGTVNCPHCGAEHPVAWSHCPTTGQPIGTGKALVGRLIADRYRIVGVLAEGGMGTVYAAEHAVMGRRVAIKRLHPELARDEASVQRFQREARAAAAIGHPNIVEVIDMGFAEDGAPYLAMEYLTGETLATALRRERRLAPARACYILGQVLSALEGVHAAGVVHRDLKPDNIFLTRKNGRGDFVKVLDFGVSKMRAADGGEASPLTRTGVMVGTPHYISPEQARGLRTHDHRVDIYAVGVMLYEMLTGRLPFDGHNYHALLQTILVGAPPPIHSLVPTVPAAVVAIVEKAMARVAADRFASAGEMLRALLPHGAIGADQGDGFALPRAGADGLDPARPAALTPVVRTRLTPPPPPARRGGRQREAPLPAPPRHRTPSRPPLPKPIEREDLVAGVAVAVARSVAAGAAGREIAIPVPRVFHATPRPFEAASSDWREADAPAHPVTVIGAPRPTPTAARVVVSDELDGEVPPDAPRVVGAFVAMALYQLRESFGIGGLDRVLSAISVESSNRLRGALITVPWVSATLIDDLAQGAEKVFGDRTGAVVVDLGRAMSIRALGTTHKHLVQGLSATAAVQRIPKIWRVFHDGGDVIVGRTPSAAYNVQVSGQAPRTLVHAQLMMGFYLGLLEVTGAHDARAEILACIELGTARTVTELRFR